MPADPRPWPKPVRGVIVAGLVVLAGVGLVVLLYRGGILALAGPFVAMIVGPVLVRMGVPWRRRRVVRLRRTLLDNLRGLRDELALATDASVAATAEDTQLALRLLTQGRETEGLAVARRLSTRGPLTRRVRATARSARRLAAASKRV